MTKIAYESLDFKKGMLIGLGVFLLCAVFLGLLGHWERQYSESSGTLSDFVSDHVDVLSVVLVAILMGLPATVLLRHRRIQCLAGMLVTVALVCGGLLAFLAATFNSVKCLGSCG